MCYIDFSDSSFCGIFREMASFLRNPSSSVTVSLTVFVLCSNRSDSDAFVCLPETYEELHAQYSIQTVASNCEPSYSDPSSIDEVYVAVLTNFIHVS